VVEVSRAAIDPIVLPAPSASTAEGVAIPGDVPRDRRRHFACFDGYRAIAAASIVVFHVAFFSGITFRHPVAGLFLARLDVGVSLFFVISGFLLYRPFVAAHLAGRAAPGTRTFLGRRVLRIVPAYWATLFFVVYVVGVVRIASVGDAIVYFCFLQIYDNRHLGGGINQAWSLCTEVSFYLALPVYAWALRRSARRRRPAIVAEVVGVFALYAGGLVVRTLIAYNGYTKTGDCRLDWLPATMDLFALGMALAVASAWHEQGGGMPRILALLGRYPWLSWAGAGAAYAVVSTVVFTTRDIGNPFTPSQIVGREALYGIIAVLLVIPGVFGPAGRGPIRRVLQSKPFVWLGVISYGVYLTHESFIDQLIRRFGLIPGHSETVRLLLAASLASIVAATLLHLLVERPALQLKHRLG